jgi:hypothetical protein
MAKKLSILEIQARRHQEFRRGSLRCEFTGSVKLEYHLGLHSCARFSDKVLATRRQARNYTATRAAQAQGTLSACPEIMSSPEAFAIASISFQWASEPRLQQAWCIGRRGQSKLYVFRSDATSFNQRRYRIRVTGSSRRSSSVKMLGALLHVTTALLVMAAHSVGKDRNERPRYS